VKIAVTCIQLIRDLDDQRARLEQFGLEVTAPEIPGQHLEGDALVAALEGCSGVIAGDDRFTAEVLDRCPELRTISKWGSGLDGIDGRAAAARGITVTNTPGMFDDEVADVAMAYLTTLARGLHLIDRGVHAGAWPKPAGRSLRGATLGIIGLGGIGRAVAARAAVAGMKVIGSDPSPASVQLAEPAGVEVRSLDDLLAASDFVSVNCPLNEGTFHLLDNSAFARMRPGVYLVNTARGAVVDTTALAAALESGRVAGAALDVMEREPPPPGDHLLSLPQVVLGSHNASNTIEASRRVHLQAIENLIRSLGLVASGQP
jgi:D-3-phosphoglycerate dehydrogenase / 2-oxoglutarate reductase